MPTVDGERHQVRFQIAVIGGVGRRFVEQLGLKDGELELGEVQSYRPRFAFDVFPDDPWSGDGAAGKALEELVPYLDALVLTDALEPGLHYSSTALERLASRLSPVKLRIPAAIFGGPALAQEWESLSQRARADRRQRARHGEGARQGAAPLQHAQHAASARRALRTAAGGATNPYVGPRNCRGPLH